MKAHVTRENSSKPGNTHFFAGKNGRFFKGQAKLNLGKPGDKYEVEADAVADSVVKGKANQGAVDSLGSNSSENAVQPKPLFNSISRLVQRKEENVLQRQEEEEAQTKQEVQRQEEEEEAAQPKLNVQHQEEEEAQTKTEIQRQEEEEAQTKVEIQSQEEEEAAQPKLEVQRQEEEEAQAKFEVQREEEEEAVQTRSNGGLTTYSNTETSSVESSIRDSRGQGSQLPDGIRSQMESALGADLSGIRVHTDSRAVAMTRELRAQAFTNQNNIYFNQGRFNTTSPAGQHLLAHEVAHTVQQGAVTPLHQEEANVNDSANQSQGNNQNDIGAANAQEEEVLDQPTEGVAEEGQAQEVNVDQPHEQRARSGGSGGGSGGGGFPRSPEEDPNFRRAESQVESEATNQQTTRPAEQEAQSAQAAAASPENERMSQAQTAQVDTMAEQEPGEFDADAFKQRLMERIESMQLPANQEEAADFENNNNIDEVNRAAQGDVAQEQNQASGAIAQSSEQEPNAAVVPEREVEAMPEADTGTPPAAVAANRAMPRSRPNSQVNQPLEENTQEVSDLMAENEITDEQLANSNEPSFTSALSAKQEAASHAQTAPASFRTEEQQTLSTNSALAESQSQLQLQEMHADRETIANQVAEQQSQTATQDTAERTRIANEINALYEAAKTDVETILENLDERVATMFSDAANNARQRFESHVEAEMDAYKSRRYSGATGAARWLHDKFMGLPDEVNRFFTQGRQIYIDEMDGALTEISQFVAQELNAAKDRIDRGKQEVADYVEALPQNLQGIGQEAAESIQNRFDELENSVDSKQDELIDSLAEQYNESLQAVDARIEEMQAANRGLVDMAIGAIRGVIDTIITIKNTLTSLLGAAVAAIQSIIADPIGFLGNLISGVAQGFRNFGANILRHLTSGLVAWLTGALGSIGITIPPNLFSLSGIFNLVMQILGLTWDHIRQKAVKKLGEPVVGALETTFEIFRILKNEGIDGLWRFVKEQFNDLKETVIDAIKEMVITKVIEAGIKWVIGLMSPAGAFVKAAMMIVDIVRFFIERGSQILQLVNAFIEGVQAVASGSVARVAQAIENALARAIPVVIGFLASLLGIGGLAAKVQKLIKRIRRRIDRAIDKVITKATKWFRRAGRRAGRAAVRFFQWWKNKKRFRGTDGRNHRLYFTGSGRGARLTVASTPTPLTAFIAGANTGGDAEKQSAKDRARALSQEIDTLKSTQVTGNETQKSRRSKEINDQIKAKMNALVPLVNKLMGGGEQSVGLLTRYLNKKVTNNDGSVSQNFINAFDSDSNKIDGKKVYKYVDGKVMRVKADQGFMRIRISDADGQKGVLIPGSEAKYVAPHTRFEPQKMRINYANGKYSASYETEKRSGEGKQTFNIDISYQQLNAAGPDKQENRTVTGTNMQKKPGGMQRGRTDSAGQGFDNAHLIGDQFGGSGYNQGLNIYPSSEKYNRKTMLDKENRIYGDISNAAPFSMTVSARISHLAEFKGASDNNLKNLLDTEFRVDNSGKQPEDVIEKGMTKKMRQKVAQDIKGVPGRFDAVTYSISQPGNSVSGASIGVDSDYEKAVKQKLGS